MRCLLLWVAMSTFYVSLLSQTDSLNQVRLERNKAIAKNFYKDLWFTNNTDKYIDYVADEYVVHDIGDRKGITEKAIDQKEIADFFWANGAWDCTLNYQIALAINLSSLRWVLSLTNCKIILSAYFR